MEIVVSGGTGQTGRRESSNESRVDHARIDPKVRQAIYCRVVAIREEIAVVEEGTFDEKDNPLCNAPHLMEDIVADDWSHPYSG